MWGSIAGNGAGHIFAVGRNGAAGHFLQEYDSNLNPVGGLYEVSVGKPGKTNKASGVYGDKNGTVHMVMDCTTGGPNEMLYNNTSWRNLDGSFQNCVQGLVGTTNGPDGDPPGWWNDDVWEVCTVDSANRVYVAYREWSQAGTGLVTKVNRNGFTEPPTAFAPTIQRQMEWNTEIAPALNGGIYVAYYVGGTCYLRGVGVGSAVPDITPPGPVTNLTAASGPLGVNLSWTNPTDTDFTGTMIRCKTTGFPTNQTDGTLVVDKANSPGSTDNYSHTGLTAGVTYYYRVFAHDETPNYDNTAPGKNVTFQPPTLTTIYTEPFVSSADGWSISLWQQGGVSPKMGWVSNAGCASGGIECVGAGMTDSTGGGLREGGELWKVISTASNGGYANISNIVVSYSLKVNGLGNDYSGTPGSGDHGLLEEQLTVSFSTDGGATWQEAAWLPRHTLDNYHTCGTRSIDLSGFPACNNNPSFALKFRWQLNTGPESPSGADIADLDNITIQGTIPDVIPQAVTGLSALASDRSVHLSWRNPWYSAIQGTMIRYKTTGYPAGPTDGTLLCDRAATPGSYDAFDHNGLVNGTTYYYAVYTHTAAPSYSPGVSVSSTPTGTCLSAKKISSGSVYLSNKIVTAVFPYDASVFIEEPDRTSGIRLFTSYNSFVPGDVVNVTGTIGNRMMGGIVSERQIVTPTISKVSSGTAIDPVAMTCRAVGGGAIPPYVKGVTGGVGLNNMGALVKIAGKVTYHASGMSFYVDDGSNVSDGTGHMGVQVECPSDMPTIAVGDVVSVVGIVEGYVPDGWTANSRYLHPRSGSDIVKTN